MASNLTRRVAVAAVAIPLVVGTVWYGGALLALLVAAVGVLGSRELAAFPRGRGLVPLGPLIVVAAAGLPLLTWAVAVQPDVRAVIEAWWPYLASLWVVGILAATLATRSPQQQPLEVASATLLIPLYAAGLPAVLLTIRHARHGTLSWEGAALACFPLVTVWLCDTAAMGVGKWVGGPRLSPRVSPGKTWSGTVAGFLAALGTAPLYHSLVFRPLGVDVVGWHLVVTAVGIGIMGQVGDLVESLFKRAAGLKDSSRLIPGHGGVLDRLDSLYFALPVTAVLYRVFGVI
jgi:phosphatidate cytidylyltransferase